MSLLHIPFPLCHVEREPSQQHPHALESELVAYASAWVPGLLGLACGHWAGEYPLGAAVSTVGWSRVSGLCPLNANSNNQNSLVKCPLGRGVNSPH